MYILTGGAGFIGSVFLGRLNDQGIDDVLIVDDLGKSEKWKNLIGTRFADYLHKSDFLRMLEENRMPSGVKAVIHLGACSSTTETDAEYVIQNNFRFSCKLAEWAKNNSTRFMYASSAATYGDGRQGFSDDIKFIPTLRPLNVYGYSKHAFDEWMIRRGYLSNAVGLKFFNVFGPNEYHKGSMTSVVYKAFYEIRESGVVRLFRSNSPDFADGEQKRDFIFVKDCADVLWWLLENTNVNGIFNLGTGTARSWNDLVTAIFQALELKTSIEYKDMPVSMQKKYQNFTQAEMSKLTAAGYSKPFTKLEDAVRDYVKNHLEKL